MVVTYRTAATSVLEVPSPGRGGGRLSCLKTPPSLTSRISQWLRAPFSHPAPARTPGSHLFWRAGGDVAEPPERQHPHQQAGVLLPPRHVIHHGLQQDQVIHHITIEELKQKKDSASTGQGAREPRGRRWLCFGHSYSFTLGKSPGRLDLSPGSPQTLTPHPPSRGRAGGALSPCTPSGRHLDLGNLQ